MKKIPDHFSDECYLDMMHRITGVNIEVLKIYVKRNNPILGSLTTKDLINSKISEEFHYITRQLKLERLYNNIKKK